MQAKLNRKRQLLYEKALLVFQKDEEKFSKTNDDLERNRIHRNIAYKMEERKMLVDLIEMKRERKRFAKEAFARNKGNKTIDDIAKELKPNKRVLYDAGLKLDRKFSKLPQMDDTQTSTPQITRRLSDESKYFTWTLGLPRLAINNLTSTFDSIVCKEQKSPKTQLQTWIEKKGKDYKLQE